MTLTGVQPATAATTTATGGECSEVDATATPGAHLAFHNLEGEARTVFLDAI